jgi:hypothetical protein
VKSLHVDQAIEVYIAATDQEKKAIRQAIEEKQREINTFTHDPEKRAELHKAYRDALHPQPKFKAGTV